MALLELSVIFGSALLPLLVIIGALVLLWETWKIAFHYILRAWKRGHKDAQDEITKEFL